MSQRLCLVLQGTDRYAEVLLDLRTPQRIFAQRLQMFVSEIDGKTPTAAHLEKFLDSLHEQAGTTEEEAWYTLELRKFTSLSDWPELPS